MPLPWNPSNRIDYLWKFKYVITKCCTNHSVCLQSLAGETITCKCISEFFAMPVVLFAKLGKNYNAPEVHHTLVMPARNGISSK